MRWLLFFLLVAVGIFGSPGAEAATWRVGRDPTDCPGGCDFHDFSTGSEAGKGIERAMVSPSVFPGDTVLVYPRAVPFGSPCDESEAFGILFRIKSGVVLKVASGPGTVCIAGGGNVEAGVTFLNTSEATVVDGFRFRWDSTTSGLGGGVACFAASGVVKNCIFDGCLAGTGSGVYEFLSDVRIDNNLFINNECRAGGGVVALSSSPALVVNNTFYRSTAPFGFQGAAFYASDSGHTLDKNIITDCIGASAFYCAGSNPATVTCNLFWNNPIGVGGGTCADQTGTGGNQNGNPGYCDVTLENYNVCANSPALIGPCGRIGYVPPDGGGCPNCPGTTSVEPLSWGRVKSLYR
jgi:hypothetical protein